ncbi:MAG: site-specific integrase [Clostridia bacterium]|nr:site-specific integrase [Clostridia bacterium]
MQVKVLIVLSMHFKNLTSQKTYLRKQSDIMMIVLSISGQYYDTAKKCNTLNQEAIMGYISFLKERNVKEVTINSYLRGTRVIFSYFMEMGYTKPFKITLIKTEKTIKPTYTDYELQLLLKKPDLNKCNFSEYRNWVIVNYLLATGNRASTVSNLKIENIDFSNETIILTKTKNRKQQIIPLSRSLVQILRDYLKYRKGSNDDYLFCNTYGNRLTVYALQHTIYLYNKSKGVLKTSLHLFRHTFAKKWILNGGDIFRLQKILGHSSLDMVKEYVNMFSEDLHQNFNEFNPLEQFTTVKKYMPMKR